MGRVQSQRVAGADTNVISRLLADGNHNSRNNPCTFNGVIISVIDNTLDTANGTISIYSDDTGTDTTNLIFRTDYDFHSNFTKSSTTEAYYFTNGIYCKIALRIECTSWTNLEVFVLHS